MGWFGYNKNSMKWQEFCSLISETNVLNEHLYRMHFFKGTSELRKRILIILITP